MYIYLYTGPQLRLRKARFQRDSVPGRCNAAEALAKDWGKFEGGWDFHAEDLHAHGACKSVQIRACFLECFQCHDLHVICSDLQGNFHMNCGCPEV